MSVFPSSCRSGLGGCSCPCVAGLVSRPVRAFVTPPASQCQLKPDSLSAVRPQHTLSPHRAPPTPTIFFSLSFFYYIIVSSTEIWFILSNIATHVSSVKSFRLNSWLQQLRRLMVGSVYTVFNVNGQIRRFYSHKSFGKDVLETNFQEQECKQTMASEVVFMILAVLCLEKPKKKNHLRSRHRLKQRLRCHTWQRLRCHVWQRKRGNGWSLNQAHFSLACHRANIC